MSYLSIHEMTQFGQLFTIDAPLATARISEDGVQRSSSRSSTHRPSEEAHGSSQASDEPVSELEDDEQPIIILPEDLIEPRSISPGTQSSRKGKEKESLWFDPADELVNIDLNGERRMRKLARGKNGNSKVGGKEFEKRLREQYVRLDPVEY